LTLQPDRKKEPDIGKKNRHRKREKTGVSGEKSRVKKLKAP